MSPAEAELLEFVRGITRRGMARRISVDTHLFEARAIDSMNVLKLVGYVERKLGRRLSDGEIVMTNFHSVHAMAITFLEASRHAKRARAAR